MSLWLTRILPDQTCRQTRRDLASAVGMHHRLMSLFPDGLGANAREQLGVLFRVEDGPAGSQILFQSRHRPDLQRLPADYGQAASKELAPLVAALAPGLAVRYRIAASAVRKPGQTTREAYGLSAVVPLKGRLADEWWLRQAEASGLKTAAVHSTPLDTARGERSQDNSPVRHSRILFEGTALITDADLLRRRLTDGIGRGKAYGCGLLSLAPTRTAP